MPLFEIAVKRLPGCEDLPLPRKMSRGASGLDLHAAVDQPVTLTPGRWKLIPTGIALEMPEGVEAQVRPRSGLALKHGVTVLNSPGTIDSDYRGEVGVILINLGDEPFVLHRGDRIAQLVFGRVLDVRLKEVERLGFTERGGGGFGHTGK
ncbi:MAG: dUTP diphosphatase [Planifilum sp.]|jgi:dUTP pyrophosphatase|uniref:dUTP diphosphatase n=1 Tax=Planifilum fulgidum TaxID=201973 RepID=UPI000B8231D5|nr:dUTP diphosphatase [Planifilum fulgidum]MBO2496344.1 dUTP diphosphatase [Bacillota bacterium]MBO2531740.1 dUTP diphosphatase [Thermoactinomycetaceae bacterium]